MPLPLPPSISFAHSRCHTHDTLHCPRSSPSRTLAGGVPSLYNAARPHCGSKHASPRLLDPLAPSSRSARSRRTPAPRPARCARCVAESSKALQPLI
ncbi:hypothetical protein VPH35_062082 [Triticum aestivum]